MDNLTHSLVGALFGQMGLKRRTGLAMPTLIIAANIPDIDATCTVFGMRSLAMRRGITHGPIAMVLLPIVLALAMLAWDRWQRRHGKRPSDRPPVRLGWLLGLSYLGCLSHPAFDWLNNYGIRLLEPFSHRWFYGDTLFIIDVWIWAALILAVGLSLRWERAGRPQWRRPAWIGFAAIGAYVLGNGIITGHAERQAADMLAASRGREPELIVANAQPLTFWRREMLWRDGSDIGSGRYVVGEGTQLGLIQRNLYGAVDLGPLMKTNPDARAFLFWSRMPVVERRGTEYRLYDQRFDNPIGGDRFALTFPGAMTASAIVWLRRDLRLADQPAFCAAAAEGPVIPVYVLDDARASGRKLGGASRWWLHGSLEALGRQLRKHDSRLILRRGDAVKEIARIASDTGARTVHALRHYEPWWREAEEQLAGKLDLCLHDGNYLLPPGSVLTGSGQPYKIYSPFAKAAMQRLPDREPYEAPELTEPESWPASDDLDDWKLLPGKPDWAGGLRKQWSCGEAAARAALDDFLDSVADYEADRNSPSIEGTSRLSPHLHWGEISPTQVWHALADRRGQGVSTFRNELLWRDYAQNVVCQFPDYSEQSYREDFRHLHWRSSEAELVAWRQGRTGYPIVDAGMRQLWATGWMHNRVRMIAASFLIKHLLIDWREGERWFWDTLVDADYANNGVNWQWVAGTGVDANLFTRIMAPLGQSEKFAAADYIREWVPELAGLSDEDIHDPSDQKRPSDYPEKLIGHREARERALAAHRKMKTGRRS